MSQITAVHSLSVSRLRNTGESVCICEACPTKHLSQRSYTGVMVVAESNCWYTYNLTTSVHTAQLQQGKICIAFLASEKSEMTLDPAGMDPAGNGINCTSG